VGHRISIVDLDRAEGQAVGGVGLAGHTLKAPSSCEVRGEAMVIASAEHVGDVGRVVDRPALVGTL